MKRSDYAGQYGFLISIKKTVIEPSSVPVVGGTGVFYKPKFHGYTKDWREAGLYGKTRGLAEVCRTGHACEYVPIDESFSESVLAANANPIELTADQSVTD